MLAKLIRRAALAIAEALSEPKADAASADSPDRAAELDARLAEIEAKARADAAAKLVSVRRSMISAKARADQIEARIRDAGDTRETLLRILTAGPASVPQESIADLPGQAAEYVALLSASHGYAGAIREFNKLAGRLETAAAVASH